MSKTRDQRETKADHALQTAQTPTGRQARHDAPGNGQRKHVIKLVIFMFGVPVSLIAISMATRGCV